MYSETFRPLVGPYLKYGRASDQSPAQRDGPSIDPVSKAASLSEQAYDRIKAAIIAGELNGNELYSVSQIASLLGVSRTPVREALLALAGEGLLTMHRNRGFQVVTISKADQEEIVDVRRLLEVPAMLRLLEADPPPVDVFRRARDIYLDMEAAAESGDLMSFLELDREFHLTLIDAAGNRRLTAIVGDLRDHMSLPGLRNLAKGGHLYETVSEHLLLLDAIEAGDQKAVIQVMNRHLDRTLAEWA